MTRGRKPKPPQLSVVEGNPGKRAKKKVGRSQPSKKPSAPNFLNTDAKREWRRITAVMGALGIFSDADRSVVAAYCQAYGRWVQAERALSKLAGNDPQTHGLMIRSSKGNAIQNPLVGTANKAASDMTKYAAQLGLDPTARARLGIGESGNDADPAEKYF